METDEITHDEESERGETATPEDAPTNGHELVPGPRGGQLHRGSPPRTATSKGGFPGAGRPRKNPPTIPASAEHIATVGEPTPPAPDDPLSELAVKIKAQYDAGQALDRRRDELKEQKSDAEASLTAAKRVLGNFLADGADDTRLAVSRTRVRDLEGTIEECGAAIEELGRRIAWSNTQIERLEHEQGDKRLELTRERYRAACDEAFATIAVLHAQLVPLFAEIEARGREANSAQQAIYVRDKVKPQPFSGYWVPHAPTNHVLEAMRHGHVRNLGLYDVLEVIERVATDATPQAIERKRQEQVAESNRRMWDDIRERARQEGEIATELYRERQHPAVEHARQQGGDAAAKREALVIAEHALREHRDPMEIRNPSRQPYTANP